MRNWQAAFELPATIAAACLTLEYAVSGAAVARSWGDKVVLWLQRQILVNEEDASNWVQTYLQPGYNLNPMAFCVCVASVVLLMDGVKESKRVTNFFTATKVGLVLFMSVGGFILTRKENLVPFVPPQFGASSVLRGSTSCFFGYLGYDEVCCLGGESLNPKRDMPLAILWTLGIVTSLYVAASLALTGMQPYQNIDEMSAFPNAFHENNVHWAAQIAAFGEVFTLPVVVLISLMAQPRLQYAMAQDGLLPPIFGKVDPTGNLKNGTLLSGIFMTLIATVVPFQYLDDLISAGILLAFSMTNGSLILLRCESPSHDPLLLERLLVLYNALSLGTGLILSKSGSSYIAIFLSMIMVVATIATAIFLGRKCPRGIFFGGLRVSTGVGNINDQEGYFQTPCVPYLPLLGTFINWCLISQLEAFGLFLLLLYVGLATAFYFCFGAKHSVGNAGGWRHAHYERVQSTGMRQVIGPVEEEFLDVREDDILLRGISLPRVSQQNVKAKSSPQLSFS